MEKNKSMVIAIWALIAVIVVFIFVYAKMNRYEYRTITVNGARHVDVVEKGTYIPVEKTEVYDKWTGQIVR